MNSLFAKHKALLEEARRAARSRNYWSAYPEIPSGKIYGASAKSEGLAAHERQLGNPFAMDRHPEDDRTGAEVSPFGPVLGISYPKASVATLVKASKNAGRAWAASSVEARTGICMEILDRLNRRSFEMANAVMHTTGQGFPMAFQAGGPHAQDRGLEAVAYAFEEMTRTPAQARWSKPQGKRDAIVMDKEWRILPRGVALVIGCQTFPTWNSYPAIFADLATGNTVIVKPHPGAILPLAITVDIARTVLLEEGFDPNVILLAADEAGAEITKDLVRNADVALIDYTGSSTFGSWLRENAGNAQVFTEETGVNSIVIADSADFEGMCENIAFSLALYSGQMCTAPQDIFVPRGGIASDEGHKSFDDVAQGIASAVDALLADPAVAANVCGALASPATLDRVHQARSLGRVVRNSMQLSDAGGARTATPLILAVDVHETDVHEEERFGPIAFMVATDDADHAIAEAAGLARRKGAITAALYAGGDSVVDSASDAFTAAGVNLSCNLTGGIYVNQSAAFSDYHVTGANPAGNASLTDAAFVASRFRTVMLRRMAPARCPNSRAAC